MGYRKKYFTADPFQALNAMSSSLKLLKIGGSTSSFNNGSNQEIELSKCLHKLFFQLLQMLEKLHDMIKTVQASPNAQVRKIYNLKKHNIDFFRCFGHWLKFLLSIKVISIYMFFMVTVIRRYRNTTSLLQFYAYNVIF